MNASIIAPAFANDVREELGLKNQEVVEDIVQLINVKAGYEYEESTFSEPFYGSSEYKGNGQFKITYNLKFDWNIAFKRFTLAHELGHISLHHQYLREHILHRCFAHDQFIKQMEIDADCFAANFLAPSKACEFLLSGKDLVPATIKALADHFIISIYAAVLRFIDLTDLVCSIIVCNSNFKTEYERRSTRMEQMLKHSHVSKTNIHANTLTYEYINGKRDKDTAETVLNLWHTRLPREVPAIESVVDLGYNGKYVTLLTPLVSYLDEYLSEAE